MNPPQKLASALVALLLSGCNGNQLRPIAPPGKSTPVARLSELGIFEGDPKQQQPRAEFVPYDVNVALYADSTIKRRFVFVPAGTHVRATAGYWELPLGSYLVKTFAFPIDARNPALGERLVETRFMVKEAGGFLASTYVWNEAQTDALVSTGDLDVPVHWIDRAGQAHEESFHVPGTSECASCHQNRALGWRSRQLDHSGSYADGSQGQIAHLAARGVLDHAPPAQEVLSDPFGDAPLERRARSYLDANCSHCHGAGGSAQDTELFWDLEHTTRKNLPACRASDVPFSDPVLVPGHPEQSEFLERMSSSSSLTRMPRGPTRVPDAQGIALLSAWVASMEPMQCP